MAFADLRDYDNLNGALALLLELRNTSGVVQQRIAVADKWFEATFLSPWGELHTTGAVQSWGEFGYESDFYRFGAELIHGDGSVTIGSHRLAGVGYALHLLLRYYVLNGSPAVICQCIEDPTDGTWYAEPVFRGVVDNVRDMTTGQVQLELVDRSVVSPVIPPESVNEIDFPDAPKESIGARLPVVFGARDVSDNRLFFGTDTHRAHPVVLIDENVDEEDWGAVWLIAAHELYDPTPGDPGRFLVDDPDLNARGVPTTKAYVTNNDTDGCRWKQKPPTLWEVAIPVHPVHKEPDNDTHTDDDRKNAWDYDSRTTLTLDAEKLLCGVLPDMSAMGAIRDVWVQVWIAAGGSGSGKFGLKGTSYTGPGLPWKGGYSSIPFLAYEGTYLHDVTSTIGGTWEFGEWFVAFEVDASSQAIIREATLRVRYTPDLMVEIQSLGGNSEQNQWYASGPKGGSGKAGHTLSSLVRNRTRPAMLATTYGAPDDASGTYTGTADGPMSKGADTLHWLTANYRGLTSDDYVTDASDHGSFQTARTALGSYHVLEGAYVAAEDSWAAKNHLCRECRAVPIFNAEGKEGMVVISPSPTADYRSGYKWYVDEHFIRDSFRFGRTPGGDVRAKVYVDFAYDQVNDTFLRSAWITPDGSDNGFGTQDEDGTGEREDQAAAAASIYHCEGEYRLRAYHVHKQGVAKSLRNFSFDNISRTRLWIEFLCGRHACDLAVGNVIELGDDTINGVLPPDPYEPSNGWDDYKWYVAAVTRTDSRDALSQYRVFAVEAIEPDTPSDWIAAADD